MSKVVIYTDGASANNQDAEKRIGGWGAILILVDDQERRDTRPEAYKELSGRLPGATNNYSELEAVRQALLALKYEGLDVCVYTDSEYVIGVLSRHWKALRNKEQIAEIKSLMSKHTVRFEKVAGHSDNEYNNRADALAVAATQ
jgi:ribonuclease HI